DISLDVGPGSQVDQMAQIMTRLEDVLVERGPELVIVVGDVTSTLAAALAAALASAREIPVGHVEAGLRSRDWSMPEERHRVPTLFPVHPRTQQRLDALGLDTSAGDLRLLSPVGYPTFISLLSAAAVVLTDSGGIQEEAVVLGTPCLTLRENTERPITLELGN